MISAPDSSAAAAGGGTAPGLPLALADAARERLRRAGYAYLESPASAALLRAAGLQDWAGFGASWQDLGLDGYMADGGRYRRRRHAAFALSAQRIERKPHQPHYQSRDYNPLNGGLERWFAPIAESVGQHPALRATLRLAHELFSELTDPAVRPPLWHVEVHQFRIEARPDQPGLPTPEGVHQDGVDWVLVLLIQRDNVASGDTTILDLARRPLGRFTLAQPMDIALVDDSRVFHGVTPIQALDPARPGHRDVLVVTLRR